MFDGLWDHILDWAVEADPIDNIRFIAQGMTRDAPCLTIAWTGGAHGRMKRALQGISYTELCDRRNSTITIGVNRCDLERVREALRNAGLL